MNNKPTAETELKSPTLSETTAYLKGMMERESISYALQKELYQKRRSSNTGTSQPSATEANSDTYTFPTFTTFSAAAEVRAPTAAIAESNREIPDMTSFTALKNLYESQLKQHPFGSVSCDNDVLDELTRQPDDSSLFCSTDSTDGATGNCYNKIKVSDAQVGMQTVDLMQLGSICGEGKVIDASSQFFNNFYG